MNEKIMKIIKLKNKYKKMNANSVFIHLTVGEGPTL